jgi:hypothetical protein
MFNWHGGMHELWTHAPTRDRAFANICSRLGRLVGYSARGVRNYFRGSVRYELTEAKEG